jgi:hypothetical protein
MTRLLLRVGSTARALRDVMVVTCALTVVGCGDQSGPDGPVKVDVDTGGSWPIPAIEANVATRAADTIRTERVLSLSNERHVLSITGLGQGGSKFDRAFRIQLTNKQGMVIDTLLTKNSFSDSLDADLLERAGLYALDFDCVRSQSLYFDVSIGVDETDHVQFIDFFLTYAGPKKGRLVYWTKLEEIDAVE